MFPPLIHDITTDTTDPPRFSVLAALRAKTPNGTEYGGPAVAAAQAAAYPDIKPVLLAVRPATAFERAFAAARGMGWTIAAADPAAGIIEATDTTRWLRFKDDIVIRVRPSDSGSRIDARSVSRVGRGDFGANAKRIRQFLSRLIPADSPPPHAV